MNKHDFVDDYINIFHWLQWQSSGERFARSDCTCVPADLGLRSSQTTA